MIRKSTNEIFIHHNCEKQKVFKARFIIVAGKTFNIILICIETIGTGKTNSWPKIEY